MINPEDIMDMACLTRDEIAAIAEHEALPEIEAARLSEYLMHVHHGPQAVHRMICEDIRTALHRGELSHARVLCGTLHRFVADHPDAVRGSG
jgi:hypothetical protein